ncbi:MAG: hypothetical protein NTU47_14950 [Ignavibacteriales bacterium]|nr:hypothetical protein [Ignavibacteriales bacterium]
MQFVRVQSDYMPAGYDPLGYDVDHSLNGVSVKITEFGRFYELRDTLLWTSDTSRYKFPIRTYFLDSFTPLRGRAYRVVVRVSPYREVNVGVTVPDRAKISLGAAASEILDRPDKLPVGAIMNYLVQLSKSTKGYIARFYVYYDVLKQNEWFEEAVEVPITSASSDNSTITHPRYPRMMPASSTSQENIVYRNAYYKWAIDQVNDKYKSTQVIFKWIVLVVLQADQNLYEYYVSAHWEQDPYSTRLDEPLGSRAGTGVGVVGAYGLDSLVYLLPYDFWGNR